MSQEDIYVLVVDNDQSHKIGGKEFFDDGGPLVMEQYVRSASLPEIQKRAEYLGKTHGGIRIAKLVFVTDATDEQTKSEV